MAYKIKTLKSEYGKKQVIKNQNKQMAYGNICRTNHIDDDFGPMFDIHNDKYLKSASTGNMNSADIMNKIRNNSKNTAQSNESGWGFKKHL